MAYLSGNAIYVRNSVRLGEENAICGGIDITRNTFEDNVGGSFFSNGGAVSVSCELLIKEVKQDYFSSSTQHFTDVHAVKEQQSIFIDPYTHQE
eukprot:CAMPEP_0170547970 /NCGR_PEP_ID=MMETSP0211-20121228/6277_1 /TAXON_ID=311385 /ORGANISM="Pseudokeronopsis sp., Strain OXSARD2" /LENGTH=93 /DNA_ID=CAMNT_0010853223 /DNA_START=745 /DNA_END=1026 /DNA_ORIENTATION=+